MNVGAMKHWIQHEPSAISWMQRVIRAFGQLLPEADKKIQCHWGIYTCYRAPLKWILETESSYRMASVIPDPVSAASKVAQALLALNIHSAGTSGGLFFYPDISGEDIYEYADKFDLLSGDKECCPASSTVIVRALDEIFRSSSAGASPESLGDENNTVVQVTLFAVMAAYIAFLYDVFRITWNKKHQADERFLRSRYGHPFSIESLNTALEENPVESKTYLFYIMLMTPIIKALKVQQEVLILQKYLENLLSSDTDIPEILEPVQSHVLLMLNRINSYLGSIASYPYIDLGVADLKLIFGEIADPS